MLNSGTTMVEDRFEATTLAAVSVGGRTVIPAGAVMRGVVSDGANGVAPFEAHERPDWPV